jgi:hypothetical protein
MSTQIHSNLDCFELRKSCIMLQCLLWIWNFESMHGIWANTKTERETKICKEQSEGTFTYNIWDKSRSVGVVREKFDIIFSQVQLMFSLCIFDIQSMFWEPNCIWFGWNGHNQMKMLAFFFHQGKSTASHKTCLFHLYSKWVVGVEWGSTESIFLGMNLKEW